MRKVKQIEAHLYNHQKELGVAVPFDPEDMVQVEGQVPKRFEQVVTKKLNELGMLNQGLINFYYTVAFNEGYAFYIDKH